jgi:hypothetical protein
MLGNSGRVEKLALSQEVLSSVKIVMKISQYTRTFRA